MHSRWRLSSHLRRCIKTDAREKLLLVMALFISCEVSLFRLASDRSLVAGWRSVRRRVEISSVAVATDVFADFSLWVCVAASVVGHLETSGMEMESDEELEWACLVCFSGNGILDGDGFRAAMLVDFSGGSFELGSGGFGS